MRENTGLYAVVRDWLETFLAHARENYEAPIPRYVEQELRGYLRCGVFAHGFVRAHCDACGHDLLVAFSCKGRAVCPSCTGRRMANVAAHLVDRVLPPVPVRQWVLSPSDSSGPEQPGLEDGLDACATAAMHGGNMRTLRDLVDAEADGGAACDPLPSEQGALDLGGFNLHAGVAIAADDDLGRERLMRYGARPPLALERMRRLPGGRIAYRVKKLRGGRAKHRVMTPLELLARLAALVPPPRYPLVRYAGVLGPRSSWRRDIAPRARGPTPCRRQVGNERDETGAQSVPAGKPKRATARQPVERPARGHARSASLGSDATPSPDTSSLPGTAPRPAAPVASLALAPNVLSVSHWNRLLGGVLYAATPRVDWATLLRRSFEVDVFACPKCAGRLRVLGEVTEPAAVRLVLQSLGLPTEAPRAARARDPTDLLAEWAAD